MNCPNCSSLMQEVRKYDIDIDYCTNCKGVWLDRGEIDKIASMQTRYDEEHYRSYHRDRDFDDYDDDYYHYGGHRRRRGRERRCDPVSGWRRTDPYRLPRRLPPRVAASCVRSAQ